MGKLDKFIPGKGDPWDVAKAAHLARRAGFAATPQAIQRLVLLGVDRAVQRFVDYPQEDQDFEKRIEERGGELTELSGSPGVGTFQQVDVLRRWWFYRMAYSPQPLQEKLTLFWHDHFACQQGKIVRAPLILGQNRLFRRFSNGSFRDLLLGVAKDPAMLVFLDNRENVKANPNENWARELLELFTLGVGQYTQKDVSELARVFTGWSTPQKNVPVFVFNSREHDPADKLLFGKKLAGMSGESGMDEGRTALDRILARKDCARFLAAKLIAWFVQHEPDQKATEELATELAERFEKRAMITRSRPHFCEIGPFGAGKEVALAALAHDMGIDRKDVIAFGDGPGDAEMLKWAGTGVAVANGHPDALAAADVVVEGLPGIGVAEYLRQLG